MQQPHREKDVKDAPEETTQATSVLRTETARVATSERTKRRAISNVDA